MIGIVVWIAGLKSSPDVPMRGLDNVRPDICPPRYGAVFAVPVLMGLRSYKQRKTWKTSIC